MCHHDLPDSLLTAGLTANTLRYGPTREMNQPRLRNDSGRHRRKPNADPIGPATGGLTNNLVRTNSQNNGQPADDLDRTDTGGLTNNLVRTVWQNDARHSSDLDSTTIPVSRTTS